MPRGRKDLQAQNLPKSKKHKKDREGEEDEPFRSSNSVGELWQKVHFYLLKETFGYLDLRNSTKLSRVSTSWRNISNKTVGTNKGVVFLDWRISDAAREQMGEALMNSKSWMTVFTVKITGIKHFVSVGMASIFENYENFEEHEKLFSFPHSLSKVTFWQDSFGETEVFEVAEFLLDEFDSVRLVNCTISVADSIIEFDNGYYNPAWGGIELNALGWSLEFKMPLLVFDETSKILTEDGGCQRKWLYDQFDELDQIWPYGEDQLAWLIKSLNSLKGDVLQTVKYADKKFLEWRACYDFERKKSLLKPMSIISKATSNKRMLDSLDCAFLGRLLVCLDGNNDIPTFKSPPHAFPDEIEAC